MHKVNKRISLWTLFVGLKFQEILFMDAELNKGSFCEQNWGNGFDGFVLVRSTNKKKNVFKFVLFIFAACVKNKYV